ncbi:MAG TPA: endonuclease/exonuclease/phosphatase family protein [Vicinamibacterales bacterium]
MAWLSRIAIVVVLTPLFVVFIRHDGPQYTMAVALQSWSKPYFNVEPYRATPNCDGAADCETGTLKVMTYNVMCRVCQVANYDTWDERWPHLEDVIAKYDADLLGLQELGGYGDIDRVVKAFPQYAYETYRFGPWTDGDAALFYRRDRFDLLDAGQMWLSPKPALPFAHNWKTLSVPRYVNWVYLRQKRNGFRFLFVNTHFDNNGTNKEPSAALFARTFRSVAESTPIIATGDFNTGQRDDRYKTLLGVADGGAVFKDTMDLAPAQLLCTAIPSGMTAEDVHIHADLPWTVDHVLLAGPVEATVTSWVQDATVYGPQKRWPSDHPSVFAHLNIRMR